MGKSIKIAICLMILCCFLPTCAFASGAVADMYEPTMLSKGGAYYMVELHTDTLMFNKNEHKQMYPASLTKIMTAILVLEHCPDLNEKVVYSQEAYDWVEAQYAAAGGNVSSAGLHLG